MCKSQINVQCTFITSIALNKVVYFYNLFNFHTRYKHLRVLKKKQQQPSSHEKKDLLFKNICISQRNHNLNKKKKLYLHHERDMPQGCACLCCTFIFTNIGPWLKRKKEGRSALRPFTEYMCRPIYFIIHILKLHKPI